MLYEIPRFEKNDKKQHLKMGNTPEIIPWCEGSQLYYILYLHVCEVQGSWIKFVGIDYIKITLA